MRTPTVLIRGKINPTIKLKGKTNASIIKIYPELENIEITPTVEDKKYKSEMYGFDEILVKGVQSYIDEDIKPEYIKEGVDILGVVGKYKGVDSSDATATTEDILLGKTAYVNNEKIEGSMQEYDGSYEGNVSEALKITDCSYLFYYGARLGQVNDILKTCANYNKVNYMFGNCSLLKNENIDFALLDFSNVINMQYVFDGCSSLKTIDFSNLKNNKTEVWIYTFRNCKVLETLDLSGFEMDKTKNISSPFQSCSELTNLKGFKNLGKAYTEQTSNYSAYSLVLNNSPKLTHESLMNVINNLYDLNLTYNVANGGTLYRQSLKIGSTNLTKLTEEDIAIATNKGWDVT